MKEKLKALTKETAIYGVSTIVGRFLGFILVPFYTNVFNPTEYGLFGYIYAYMAFMNIVYIYGMDAAFMKYYSLSKNQNQKKDTFSTPFIFVLMTSAVLSLIILLLQVPINSALGIPINYSTLIYYVSAILFLDGIAMVPFAHLRMRNKSVKFASIKIINILINLFLNIILVLYYNMGIEAIFISNLVSSAFSIVVLIPDILREVQFKIDKENLNRMLKFALPYLPASFAATVVQVIDRPILEYLTNVKVLGIYQANYKLGIFMMLFVSMFQSAWHPFLLTNAKEKNAKELFARVLTLFLVVTSLIWIVLSLFIQDIAQFPLFHGKSLIGEKYWDGLIIVPIILLGYIFHGMYVNFTAGIYIEEKTKYLPAITGAGAIVNVVVNFTLIPIMGILGAALATLASYMVMSFGIFIVVQKYYKIEYEYFKIIRVLLLLLISCGTYYYLYYNIDFNLLIKFMFLIVFSALLFLLKVVDFSDVKSTFRLLFKR